MRRFCFVILLISSMVIAGSAQADALSKSFSDLNETLHTTTAQKTESDDNNNKQIMQVIDDGSKDIGTAIAISKAAAQAQQDRLKLPQYDLHSNINMERIRSALTTRDLESDLNRIYLQSALGYANVVGVDTETNTNMNQYGGIPGISDLYTLYIDLFCIPGSNSVPANCGSQRATYGLNGAESFIDFFTQDKTWKRATVFSVMKLARSFFGYYPDRGNIGEIKLDPNGYLSQQAEFSRSALRMSVLDYLASRRAPTSSSTYAALSLAFRNFTGTQDISSLDYQAVCTKNAVDQTAAEAYLCSITSDPTPTDNRIISQAAIERVTQYDAYMTPNFEKILQDRHVSLDKLEIYIKAQQLTQDYRELHLLKMHVATVAMNMMNIVKPSPNSSFDQANTYGE